MILSIPSFLRPVQENMCQEQFLLIWNPVLLVSTRINWHYSFNQEVQLSLFTVQLFQVPEKFNQGGPVVLIFYKFLLQKSCDLLKTLGLIKCSKFRMLKSILKVFKDLICQKKIKVDQKFPDGTGINSAVFRSLCELQNPCV